MKKQYTPKQENVKKLLTYLKKIDNAKLQNK